MAILSQEPNLKLPELNPWYFLGVNSTCSEASMEAFSASFHASSPSGEDRQPEAVHELI